jgi:signal transduction histidine kinase
MRLADFIEQNRDELLGRAIGKLHSENPRLTTDELRAGLGAFLDELLEALQRDPGKSYPPPTPMRPEVAAARGAEIRRHGSPIAAVSRYFGVLSDTLGEVASDHGVSFDPREYQVLDVSLDWGIAEGIERYWTEDRVEQQVAANERVGVLAHELRNALAGAQMAYSLLRSGRIGIQSRTGAIVERAFKRMEMLLGEAIASVRSQAGARGDLRSVDIDVLLRDIVSLTPAERGIALHLRADALPEIEADESLLASAINNVVQNAVKFTKDGGNVWVRARAEDEEIVIEVEDECGGLPPGKHDELFTPFVQRGANRSGLGLGLAIVLDAVEAHAGRVDVRDLPGKGCVFTLHIPGVRPRG